MDELQAAQISYLESQERLRIAIDKTLMPILAKCKTQEDVISAKKELRSQFNCSLDGLIEVHFAIAFSGK
jgi:hypothetical protein